MMKPLALLAAAASLAIAGTSAEPASAAIKCEGPNQVTRHGLISTPWCEDNYLAHLAGLSPAAVRRDPRVKERACERAGGNLSLSRTCFGIIPSIMVPGT